MTIQYSIKQIDWILPQNLNNKLIIFLDTFVWSKIIINRSENYRALKQILKRLVKENKIHVAIYIGSVMEAGMRSDEDQFIRIINLMEELSSGVLLKHFALTFDDELQEELISKLQNRQSKLLDKNLVFGPFWEFAQNLSIEMPEWFEDFNDIKKSDFLDQLRKKIYSVRLTDFPKIFGKAGSQFKNNLVQSLQKRYQKIIPDMSFKDILAEEQKAFGSTFVLNIARGLLKTAKDDFLKDKMQDLKKSDYINCVYSCPTFYCYTHLQACLRYNRDKLKGLKSNHAYDILHLGIAIPYVDWLLCDKEMADIINRRKLGERYNTKIYIEADIENMITSLNNMFPI